MIDPETYGKFIAAGVKAQQHGLSLIEVLDRDRLLLTAERRRMLYTDLIDNLVASFEEIGAGRLLMFGHGVTHGTPAEAYEAARKWLNAYADHIRKGTYP